MTFAAPLRTGARAAALVTGKVVRSESSGVQATFFSGRLTGASARPHCGSPEPALGTRGFFSQLQCGCVFRFRRGRVADMPDALGVPVAADASRGGHSFCLRRGGQRRRGGFAGSRLIGDLLQRQRHGSLAVTGSHGGHRLFLARRRVLGGCRFLSHGQGSLSRGGAGRTLDRRCARRGFGLGHRSSWRLSCHPGRRMLLIRMTP